MLFDHNATVWSHIVTVTLVQAIDGKYSPNQSAGFRSRRHICKQHYGLYTWREKKYAYSFG